MATAPNIDPAVTLNEALRRIGFERGAHPEQRTVEARLNAAYDKGRVGFVEAPTATGKTYAIAHHALETAVREGETVVVAVPTIDLAHQMQASIVRLRAASDAYADIRPRVVLGRPQFVSTEALSEDLRPNVDAATWDAISAWLDAGAPGRSEGYADYTRDGLSVWLSARGSMIDVGDGLSLGHGETGPALAAYEGQFALDGARIHVVTHAMLARDLLSRYIAASRTRRTLGMTVEASDYAGLEPAERYDRMRDDANLQRLECESAGEGRLPDHRRLIVDEAHLLRGNFENAMSTAISLTTLLRSVEALRHQGVKGATKAIVDEVRRVRAAFIDIRSRNAMPGGGAILVDWGADDEIRNLVERLAEAVSGIKAAIDDANGAIVNRARQALTQATKYHASVRTEVSWSPVQAYPAISVGRRGISSELAFLWGRLASAALVSATLYTENVAGPSIGYTAGRLAVPEDRRLTFQPISAPWLVTPVTALLPSDAAAAALDPATADREAWLDEVARRLEDLSGEAGTLVLNTSRDTSSELAARLASAGQGWRTLDGTTGSLTALKARYLKLAADGMSPIWLAQGPAWTGLDLPDELLDTVVIPRLPYPAPVSISEEARQARRAAGQKVASYAPQAAQMAMTFKQGVGRLVRVRDARPKRLVVLDGRVGKKGAAGIEQFLRRYRTETFD